MARVKKVDILVVGAGPAGLAAGIIFARSGLRTLVAEKKSLPADKACGEGLMPVGVESLKRLGASKFLSGQDYHPFYGVSYHLQGERSASATFHSGEGWGIRRMVLSEALLHAAQEHPSLEVLEKSGVAQISRSAKGRIEASVGSQTVSARLLVGADGRNSTVRKWAGLDMTSRSPKRWGVVQHYNVSPWNNLVEVYWGPGVEAYLTPISPAQVSLAFLWDRDRYRLPGKGEQLFPLFLDLFPELKSRLKSAAPLGRVLGAGPLEQPAAGVISEGVLLIGDAGGYLDALTGEGLSTALASAEALRTSVVPVLVNNGEMGETIRKHDLKQYEKAHREIVRPYLQTTHLALFLSRKPTVLTLAMRALAAEPMLFQHFLSANMGLVPIIPGGRLLIHALAASLLNAGRRESTI
jgi:menaquinone-9 beta-reductase